MRTRAIQKIFLLVLIAALWGEYKPLKAAILFEFVCTSPANCDNDSGLSVAMSFDNSVVLPNNSITFANAGFLGWSIASGVGDGFAASGTNFLDFSGAPLNPADLQITFDATASTIALFTPLVTPDAVNFRLGSGSTGIMIFDTLPVLRITDRLDSPNTGGNQDNTSITGVMTRVGISEPNPIPLFGLILAGLFIARRLGSRRSG